MRSTVFRIGVAALLAVSLMLATAGAQAPEAAPAPKPQAPDAGDPPAAAAQAQAQAQAQAAAYAAMEAAYKAMTERARAGEKGFEKFQPVADTAAKFLALHPKDATKARLAARHVSNYYRILKQWERQVAVWSDALPFYTGSFRVYLLNQRGRALCQVKRYADAHADAEALREMAQDSKADAAVRLEAGAMALDVDAMALRGAPVLDRGALSQLAAEGEAYVMQNAGRSGFSLRAVYVVPGLQQTLGQPERTVTMCTLALTQAPEGGYLRPLLMQQQGLALAALGRTDEAQAIAAALREITDEVGARTAKRAASKIEQQIVLAPGNVPPDFTLPELVTNRPITLSGLKGQIVLLDFWATWCGPCRTVAAEHLQPLHKQYGGKGLTILSVGSPSRDTAEKQHAFAKENGYEWLKVFDAERVAFKPYKVTGIPTLVLIGRDGKIVTASTGAGCITAVRAYLAEKLGDGAAKPETNNGTAPERAPQANEATRDLLARASERLAALAREVTALAAELADARRQLAEQAAPVPNDSAPKPDGR